jgi:hypothetical protein
MITRNDDTVCDQSVGLDERDLADEAQFIISAMEAADPPAGERRSVSRVRYRVEATLRLVSDCPDDAPRPVYTRDLTPRGLGFISPAPIPLGCAGRLHLPSPGGGVDIIECKVTRCREMTYGWFDGAVSFKEETQLPDGRPSR